MDVSSHSAITSGGTVLLNWVFLVAKAALEPACWPPATTKEHCTPTAAPVSVPAPLFSHLKFKTKRPIPPYSSNQRPALWRGDTAVCWGEGDRWETGIALYVSMWVSVSKGWVGGWVRTSQAHLQSYWHAESHIWWAEKSVHRHAEAGVLQRASDSRLHQGWDPESTDFTAHHSSLPLPSFNQDPFPIYLIKAPRLLSGRQLIFAGSQEQRQCHGCICQELMNLLVWKYKGFPTYFVWLHRRSCGSAYVSTNLPEHRSSTGSIMLCECMNCESVWRNRCWYNVCVTIVENEGEKAFTA